MTVYLLSEKPFFPPATEADPDGLIAIGGDFGPERLLMAYSSGIFPWFMEEDDIFWYSPDPRSVLFPSGFRMSSSLKRLIKSGKFTTTTDTRFEDVIRECSQADRPGQDGTWITSGFIRGYLELHQRGWAHSFETWKEGELVGGLYGVSIGAAFFGESMFFKVSNASKIAFAAMVDFCLFHSFLFIDCQVESEHLNGLGATPISRLDYLDLLKVSQTRPTIKGVWRMPDQA